jgi:flagellar hook-associated protein 3 FlgL
VNLKKRQQSLEGVNLETEAVNNKSYESAWMVTLQLGSSIIPPSIFDFMK